MFIIQYDVGGNVTLRVLHARRRVRRHLRSVLHGEVAEHPRATRLHPRCARRSVRLPFRHYGRLLLDHIRPFTRPCRDTLAQVERTLAFVGTCYAGGQADGKPILRKYQ